MSEIFEMVAKTFQGLEGMLADELTALGAQEVTQGKRMVSFRGDLKTMYEANFCCRTALRILKPIYKFRASGADELYEQVKSFDWSQLMTAHSTFAIDTTVFSENFRHSRFVTYRVKDAIADFFNERDGQRPSIRLSSPDFLLNVHISGDEVTLSLDSSGEPLYKRGWREAQTEAPINEVLAAGIIKLSGWDGQCDFVDPMCGSGTFLVEAAMIAANINPGVFRQGFAFQKWADYDSDLFESIYNDESKEREFEHKIYGYDIAVQAVAIAEANVKSAGMGKYVEVKQKDIRSWEDGEAPEGGILITNPPYGERLKYQDINDIYETLGKKLKFVFKGYDAWIISYGELTDLLGLRPSVRYPLLNGDLDCELRQYKIFDGTYKEMKTAGGSLRNDDFRAADKDRGAHRAPFEETAKEGEGERKPFRRDGDRKPFRRDGDRKPFSRDGERKPFSRDGERKPFRRDGDRKPFDRDGERKPFRRDGDRKPFDRDGERKPFSREPKVRFQQPTLGKDAERPIVKGRRNSWKRREE